MQRDTNELKQRNIFQRFLTTCSQTELLFFLKFLMWTFFLTESLIITLPFSPPPFFPLFQSTITYYEVRGGFSIEIEIFGYLVIWNNKMYGYEINSEPTRTDHEIVIHQCAYTYYIFCTWKMNIYRSMFNFHYSVIQ